MGFWDADTEGNFGSQIHKLNKKQKKQFHWILQQNWYRQYLDFSH